MEILDIDMQMVREFLEIQNAPFHITSHFENLISEHDKESTRAEALQERVEQLEQNEADEIGKLQDERNALQSRLDDIEGDGMSGALETVMYWMQDALVLHKPISDPRKILRIVEEAL